MTRLILEPIRPDSNVFCLGLIFLALLGAAGVTAWELRHAPEGYEDEFGFHYLNRDLGL